MIDIRIEKFKIGEKFRVKRSITLWLVLLLLIILFVTSFPSFAGEEGVPVVNPEKIYSSNPFYHGVNDAMEKLEIRYGDILELKKIGESVNGNPILAIGIGKGKDNALVIGGMHGREAITSVLLLNQIEEILLAYASIDPYRYEGYQIKKILDDVTLWFVPLLNPDGAEISLNGGKYLDNQGLFSSIISTDRDLGRWKANLNGVDLNRNFTEDKRGTLEDAGYAFYPGPKPLSEPESQAIAEFTKEKNFVGALNVHAAGEIIYWNSQNEEIARNLSKVTGYPLVTPSENPPMPTYDTWFFKETGNPVFTIEIGEGFSLGPMEFIHYGKLWGKNRRVAIVLARELQKNQEVAIFFQGSELQLELPPIREASGRVLIPLRETMEKIGAEVEWKKESRTVSISIAGTKKEISQDLPAKILEGTTYFPLRELIEIFNYSVDWDNYTKSAFITK